MSEKEEWQSGRYHHHFSLGWNNLFPWWSTCAWNPSCTEEMITANSTSSFKCIKRICFRPELSKIACYFSSFLKDQTGRCHEPWLSSAIQPKHSSPDVGVARPVTNSEVWECKLFLWLRILAMPRAELPLVWTTPQNLWEASAVRASLKHKTTAQLRPAERCHTGCTYGFFFTFTTVKRNHGSAAITEDRESAVD